jgi:hypothetical protein
VPTISLSTLRTRVYNRVEQNFLFYPNSDVDAKINEALKVTNLFACWNQGKVGAGRTIPGRVFYRVPEGVVFPMKVYMDDRELFKDSISGISATKPKWIKGGNSAAMAWAPIGTSLFALSPASRVDSGSALEVWGVLEPDTLINDGDIPNLSDEMSELVVEYAFINLTLKEGGKVFTDASKLYKPHLKKLANLQRWESKINPAYQAEIKQIA